MIVTTRLVWCDSKKSSKEDSEVSGEEEKKEDGARRAKLIAGEVIKNWQTNSRRKTGLHKFAKDMSAEY